jgi:hypothetical protein
MADLHSSSSSVRVRKTASGDEFLLARPNKGGHWTLPTDDLGAYALAGWWPARLLDSAHVGPEVRAAILDFQLGNQKLDHQSETGNKMSDEIRRLENQIAQIRERQSKRTDFAPGEIHAITQNDAAGRPITKYVGHEGACWDSFGFGTRYVRRFMTPGNK